MFWHLFLNEEKKILKHWLVWAGIILLSVVIVLNTVAMANANPFPEILLKQVAWPMALVGYMGQFVASPLGAGFLLIAISSAATAQEYTWRTYSVCLSRGFSRGQLLAAKFLALLLPTFALISIPMIVATAICGYYTLQLNGALDFSQVDFLQMGFCVFLGAIAVLPYGALALFFSTVGRSLILPMIGGFAWILIETVSWNILTSLGEVGVNISRWLPMGVNLGLLQTSRAIARSVPESIAGFNPWESLKLFPPETSIVIICGYVLFLMIASVIVFYRQDLPG